MLAVTQLAWALGVLLVLVFLLCWWLLRQYARSDASVGSRLLIFTAWCVGWLVAAACGLSTNRFDSVRFLGFAGLVLLPIDLAVALTPGLEFRDVVVRTLAAAWQVLYWSTFALAWLILPVAMEFELSGEFTTAARITGAIRACLRQYVWVALAVIAFTVWVAIAQRLTIQQLADFAVSAADAYGQLLVAVLGGYGVVDLPRRLWRSPRGRDSRRALYARAWQIDEDLFLARSDMQRLISDTQTASARLPDGAEGAQLAKLLRVVRRAAGISRPGSSASTPGGPPTDGGAIDNGGDDDGDETRSSAGSGSLSRGVRERHPSAAFAGGAATAGAGTGAESGSSASSSSASSAMSTVGGGVGPAIASGWGIASGAAASGGSSIRGGAVVTHAGLVALHSQAVDVRARLDKATSQWETVVARGRRVLWRRLFASPRFRPAPTAGAASSASLLRSAGGGGNRSSAGYSRLPMGDGDDASTTALGADDGDNLTVASSMTSGSDGVGAGAWSAGGHGSRMGDRSIDAAGSRLMSGSSLDDDDDIDDDADIGDDDDFTEDEEARSSDGSRASSSPSSPPPTSGLVAVVHWLVSALCCCGCLGSCCGCPGVCGARARIHMCGHSVAVWRRRLRLCGWRMVAVVFAALGVALLVNEAVLPLHVLAAPPAAGPPSAPLGQPIPNLSVVAWLLQIPQTFAGRLVASALPLALLCACVFLSLFTWKPFRSLELVRPRLTSAHALLFNAVYTCRMQFALGFHYLLLASPTCAPLDVALSAAGTSGNGCVAGWSASLPSSSSVAAPIADAISAPSTSTTIAKVLSRAVAPSLLQVSGMDPDAPTSSGSVVSLAASSLASVLSANTASSLSPSAPLDTLVHSDTLVLAPTAFTQALAPNLQLREADALIPLLAVLVALLTMCSALDYAVRALGLEELSVNDPDRVNEGRRRLVAAIRRQHVATLRRRPAPGPGAAAPARSGTSHPTPSRATGGAWTGGGVASGVARRAQARAAGGVGPGYRASMPAAPSAAASRVEWVRL